MPVITNYHPQKKFTPTKFPEKFLPQPGATLLCFCPMKLISLQHAVSLARSTPIREALLDVHRKMRPSAAEPAEKWEQPGVRHFIASVVAAGDPASYLEIGSRRGHSLCCALSQTDDTDAHSFDLVIPDYGGEENPGEPLLREELAAIGYHGRFSFHPGDSHLTVPEFFADPGNRQHFDLIYVDGDHSEEGALADLEEVWPRLSVGGVLVFDDLAHPQHPYLADVWERFCSGKAFSERVSSMAQDYGWAALMR